MERNELCWCGSGKKYKKCHLMIEEKIAYHADKGEIVPTRDMLKTIPQIEGIQKSADLNTAVLDHVAAHIHAGMSTAEIDKLVYDYTTEHGGIPAPLPSDWREPHRADGLHADSPVRARRLSFDHVGLIRFRRVHHVRPVLCERRRHPRLPARHHARSLHRQPVLDEPPDRRRGRRALV